MTPKTFNKMMSRWLENPETKGFSVKDYPDGTTYSGGASPFFGENPTVFRILKEGEFYKFGNMDITEKLGIGYSDYGNVVFIKADKWIIAYDKLAKVKGGYRNETATRLLSMLSNNEHYFKFYGEVLIMRSDLVSIEKIAANCN